MTIRLVLAEDQLMVLGALGSLLDLEPDLCVVGSAPDGEQALRHVVDLLPDVLLTDIEMPGLTGLELAAEVTRRRLPTRVVIVTTFGRPGYVRRAMDATGLPCLRFQTNVAGRRAVDALLFPTRLPGLADRLTQNAYGLWRRPGGAGTTDTAARLRAETAGGA